MKKLNALVITALVVGTSTAAMAAPAVISVRAQGSISFGTSTSRPVARPTYVSSSRRPVVRDHRTYDRFDQWSNDRGGYSHEPVAIRQPAYPFQAVQDCKNWDPTLNASVCGEFDATTVIPELRGFDMVGTRDSSKESWQTISLAGKMYRTIHVEPLTGAPKLTKVDIRFEDGSLQTINLSGRATREGFTVDLPGTRRQMMRYIVFYTASGSQGLYTMYAN